MTTFEPSAHAQAPFPLKDLLAMKLSCMQGMEVYSTVLWHMKQEVDLSHLAKECIALDRKSPTAWAVMGNCLSLQKVIVMLKLGNPCDVWLSSVPCALAVMGSCLSLQKVDRHPVAGHGMSGCKLATQLWLQLTPQDCLSRQQMGSPAGLLGPGTLGAA